MNEFFLKNPNLNFILGKGGSGEGLGLVIFFTKNPNLKYNIFGGWAVIGGEGGDSVAMVSDFFYKESISKKQLRAWGEDGLGE